MCMLARDCRKKVSDKPIECYKVVLYNKAERKYTTPITMTSIGSRVIEGKEPFVAEGNEGFVGQLNGLYELYGGFIHTFAMLGTIGSSCIQFRPDNFYKYHVYKCEIPAGTEYIEEFMNREYASKRIIFKERVI